MSPTAAKRGDCCGFRSDFRKRGALYQRVHVQSVRHGRECGIETRGAVEHPVGDPLTAAGFSPGDTVLVFATPECVRVVADDAPLQSAEAGGSGSNGGLIDLVGQGSS